MHYTMTAPCTDCPFLRDGGIRLTRGRIREIAGGMLNSQGIEFQCHKTVIWDDDEDDSVIRTERDQHCAGALIFAEKQGCATQMMRISERLGLYDAAALMANTAAMDRVFGSLSEMLKTAI